MKAVLAVVGGFVLTLAVFASGLAFAAWLIVAKPVHQAKPADSVSQLWTKDAQPVDKTAQGLERMAAALPAAPDAAARMQAPDPTNTGAAAPDEGEQQARLPSAHVSWCADRYRSYNPDDNSYRSFSGQQRPCVSPYLDTVATDPAAQQPAEVGPAEVSYVEGGAAPMVATADLSDDHVQSCFSRYRSYRPEDNSYQPYSGGPRRQCE
ncbi:BA14K family protein [Mesorhizobium loti]|nr:BA14K family protein [Mesorhizobium loti]